MNLNWIFRCFFVVLISVSLSKVSAQSLRSANDTVERLISATMNNQHAKLFVHFDKTIYLPNEPIWFAAYMLSDESSHQPNVLSMLLVDNKRTIIAQKKFLMTEGKSAGSLTIPDTVVAGGYSILTYTNYLQKGKPEALFIQSITIKRVGENEKLASLKTPVTAIDSKSVSSKINIKFYPEGGDLIANLPCYVGWESKDQAGNPLMIKAVLLKDGDFIDTINTSVFGMGKFFINPKLKSKYTVSTIDGNYNSIIDLPEIKTRGVSLISPSSLVKDTLLVKIAGTLAGRYHIAIHNSRKVFAVLTNVDMKDGKLLKIALDSVPPGLAAVTVFNDFQPCAERVFYAHYGAGQMLAVKTDSLIYKKRQKVTLSFNVNNAARATVSVACMQINRIDRRYFKDIDSYQYLDREMDFLPPQLDGAGNPDEVSKYLEDVLLIHGWRRFIDTMQSSTIAIDSVSAFNGIITVNKKLVKKPAVLTLMGNSKVLFINTDKAGKFSIANSDLVTADGKMLSLFATGDDASATHISITDPFIQINQSLVGNLSVTIPEASLVDSAYQPEPLLTQNQLLKEVKIEARKDNQFFNAAATPGFHTNACGDYVCLANGLNCPYPGHTYRTSVPVKGHKYFRHDFLKPDGWLASNDIVVYEGCEIKNQSLIRFEGVNLNKEFYAYDGSSFASAEPLYNSTLYWNSEVNLDNAKQAKLSFYTGDISGAFYVIVQGVTDTGLVYNKIRFEVVK